jgi:cell division protein FtsB
MYEQNYVDLLQASVDLIRQEKLITALKAENEMLRAQMKILQCRMQKLKQTMLQEQA